MRSRCNENKHRHENNNMNVCLKLLLIREQSSELMYTFKCQIPLYDIFLSRLNILGVGDSTGTVGFSPLAMLYR